MTKRWGIGVWACALLAAGLLGSERAAAFASGSQQETNAAEVDTRAGATPLVLHLHGVEEAHRPAAAEAVRTAFLFAEELLGHRTEDPEPLAVHLYADEADYLEASRRLVDGAFDRNQAFAHSNSRSAHVVLAPPLSQELLTRLGLPYQTRRLLAHETAHLVRYAALPNHHSHPNWFCDGFGQLVASESTRGALSTLEVPWNGSLRHSVRRMALSDSLPTIEGILSGVDAEFGFHERYALRNAFAYFMHEDLGPRTQRAVHGAIARTGGGQDFSEPVRRALGDQRELDARFRRWILAAEPLWDEDRRSLAWSASGWLQIAWPDWNAGAWQRGDLPAGDFEVHGRATILPASAHQLNLRLEREGGGFYQVAFVAGTGATILSYGPEDTWTRIRHFEDPDLPLDEPFEFVVAHRERALVVTIEGRSLGQVPLPTALLRGRLGLSAQAGSAGIWHAVDVRE